MAGFTGDQLFFPVSFFCDHVRLLHLFLRANGKKKNLTSHNEALGSFRGEAKHFFPGLLEKDPSLLSFLPLSLYGLAFLV